MPCLKPSVPAVLAVPEEETRPGLSMRQRGPAWASVGQTGQGMRLREKTAWERAETPGKEKEVIRLLSSGRCSSVLLLSEPRCR